MSQNSSFAAREYNANTMNREPARLPVGKLQDDETLHAIERLTISTLKMGTLRLTSATWAV